MAKKEKEKLLHRAGSLITYESGEYSDYQVRGFFVVLDGYVEEDMREEFEKQYKPEVHKVGTPWVSENDAYIGFLIKKGLLMQIDYTPVWYY